MKIKRKKNKVLIYEVGEIQELSEMQGLSEI